MVKKQKVSATKGRKADAATTSTSKADANCDKSPGRGGKENRAPEPESSKKKGRATGDDEDGIQIGDTFPCKWQDGVHKCEILEKRFNKEKNIWEYYVHYCDFNRRLDSWVPKEHLLLDGDEKPISESQKRKAEEIAAIEEESHKSMDHAALKEHEKLTKVKNINTIELGRYQVDTWYFSPFPKEYANCDILFFCEFCLSFKREKPHLHRHQQKCMLRHPPGDEIYRNDNISLFEVDGHHNKIYCQNLCYLAKLFLDHKTLYYDVDPFLFYVMTEVDRAGCHIVGYFSKEKESEDGFNLACILTLPQYQRRGYGKFLISLSYELSKVEAKIGTPERPLSDMGLLSYRSYWTRQVLRLLSQAKGTISVNEITKKTAIHANDVVSTLQNLNLIRQKKQGQYIILVDQKVVEQHLKEAGGEGLKLDPAKLQWKPKTHKGR